MRQEIYERHGGCYSRKRETKRQADVVRRPGNTALVPFPV